MSEAMQALREGVGAVKSSDPPPIDPEHRKQLIDYQLQIEAERANESPTETYVRESRILNEETRLIIDRFNAAKASMDIIYEEAITKAGETRTAELAGIPSDRDMGIARTLKRLVDTGVVSFRVNGESVDLIVNDVSA